MSPATVSASCAGRPAATRARTMKLASRSAAMRISFVVMLVMLPLRGRDWFNASPHHKIKRASEVSPYEYDDRRKNRHHQCLLRDLSADPGPEIRPDQIRPRQAQSHRGQSGLQGLWHDGARAEVRHLRDGDRQLSARQGLRQADYAVARHHGG